MNSDVYFTIGKSHKVCEDYALAGSNKHRGSYAIISDGCSSSDHTDVGARLLCHTACSALDLVASGFNAVNVVVRASVGAHSVGLPFTECLDATLLGCFPQYTIRNLDAEWESKPLFHFYAAGDGVLAMRRRDTDVWEIVEIEFSREAPAYLRYLLNNKLLQQYFAIEGGAIRTLRFYSFNGALNLKETITEDLRDLYSWDDEYWAWQKGLSPKEYDLGLVMSDGIRSITDRSGNSMGLEESLQRLLAFKGLGGEFITRRAKRFLRDLAADGYAPNDDLSVGGVYWEEVL